MEAVYIICSTAFHITMAAFVLKALLTALNQNHESEQDRHQ